MSMHATYLDRMTERLGLLESRLRDLESRALLLGTDEARRVVADLGASLDATRDRLRALRREGATLDVEQTQSFGARFEHLSAAFGSAQQKLH